VLSRRGLLCRADRSSRGVLLSVMCPAGSDHEPLTMRRPSSTGGCYAPPPKEKGKSHPRTDHEAQRESQDVVVLMVSTLRRFFFFGRDIIQIYERHPCTCPDPFQQTVLYVT